MPKTKKQSKKVLACPKCGGREFRREVSAWEKYTANRGALQYQRTIVTDESNGGVVCARCCAPAPDSMLVDNYEACSPDIKFMPV